MVRKVFLLPVFISGPSDVDEEKKIARKVVEEVNDSLCYEKNVILRPISQSDIHSGIDSDAQSVINRNLPEYAFYVGIMWNRFGTPTLRAGSGTEEEFNNAVGRWKDDKDSVEVMFYFSEVPKPPTEIKIDQLSKVIEFKKLVGDSGVYYHEYISNDIFEKELRCALTRYALKWEDRLLKQEEASEAAVWKDMVPEEILQDIAKKVEKRMVEKLGRVDVIQTFSDEPAGTEPDPEIETAANQAVKLGAAGISVEPDTLRSIAAQLYNSGNIDVALTIMNHVISSKDVTAVDYCNIGLLYSASQRYQEAIEVYKQAVKIDPEYAKAWNNMGVDLGKIDSHEDEIMAYHNAVKADPTLAPAWTNLGVAYGEVGKHEEEIDAYKNALKADPNFAIAWNNLGLAYDENCKDEEAIEAYRRAVKVAPDLAIAWNNLGIRLGKSDKPEEEIEAYRNAVKADPALASAWTNLGVAYGESGRHKDAIEAYRRAVNADTDNADRWCSLAYAVRSYEDEESALEVYLQAVKANPSNVVLLNELAYEYCKQNLFDKAEQSIQKALYIDPDHCYSNATYGFIKLNRDELDEGRESYEKAISICPDDMPLRQKFHFEYGRVLARNGQDEAALKQLQEALAVDADYVPKADIEAEIANIKQSALNYS